MSQEGDTAVSRLGYRARQVIAAWGHVAPAPAVFHTAAARLLKAGHLPDRIIQVMNNALASADHAPSVAAVGLNYIHQNWHQLQELPNWKNIRRTTPS